MADALPFVCYFADLPDPRDDRTKRRRLDDILVVTRCAAVCGADSFEEIERFGKSRRAWLKGFLALPNGIPSHDTFNRVLAALDGCWPRSTGAGRARPQEVRRGLRPLEERPVHADRTALDRD